MSEWEALCWQFTPKGDRMLGFCGHTHRTEKSAKKCATKLNQKDAEDRLWFPRKVVYYKPMP